MPGLPASDAALARTLLRSAEAASLATLDAGGGPFASYVVTAPAADGSPLLLLSRLAVHSQNLLRDPRASLLLVSEPQGAAEAMATARLTLTGFVRPDATAATRELFLARRPEASRYAGFADFAFYRFQVAGGHIVAGFGRIASLSAADLLDTPADASAPEAPRRA